MSACAALSSAQALTITEDHGGSLLDKFFYYKSAPGPIRVKGPCESACTVVLMRDDVCVLPGATFGFHAAFIDPKVTHGRYVRSDDATKTMYFLYPKWAQEWVDDHGGLQRKMVWMSYQEARRYLPVCE